MHYFKKLTKHFIIRQALARNIFCFRLDNTNVQPIISEYIKCHILQKTNKMDLIMFFFFYISFIFSSLPFPLVTFGMFSFFSPFPYLCSIHSSHPYFKFSIFILFLICYPSSPPSTFFLHLQYIFIEEDVPGDVACLYIYHYIIQIGNAVVIGFQGFLFVPVFS